MQSNNSSRSRWIVAFLVAAVLVLLVALLACCTSSQKPCNCDPTITPTVTPSVTPTATATPTNSATATKTSTNVPPTETSTPANTTATPTSTATRISTATATRTVTSTPTATPTNTPSYIPQPGTIALGDVNTPKQMCYDRTRNAVYIVEQGTGSLLKFDLASKTIIARLYVGKIPWGLACDGNRAYVGIVGERLIRVVDLDNFKWAEKLGFKLTNYGAPARIAVSRDQLVVLLKDTNKVIFPDKWGLAEIAVVETEMANFDVKIVGEMAYVTTQVGVRVFAIDLNSHRIVWQANLKNASEEWKPYSLAVDPGTGRVLVSVQLLGSSEYAIFAYHLDGSFAERLPGCNVGEGGDFIYLEHGSDSRRFALACFGEGKVFFLDAQGHKTGEYVSGGNPFGFVEIGKEKYGLGLKGKDKFLLLDLD